MSLSTIRVLQVLAFVAFVAGFATLGAHMLLQGLLLEHELTYVVYGMAGAGLAAAVLAVQAARKIDAGRLSWAGVSGLVLNALLLAATFFSTTVLVALPPVEFALDVGDTLPEFVTPPRSLDDQPLELSELRGERVVLLFYRGGWCPFCQAELAGLNSRYDELAPVATIIAISGDLPDAVAAYARQRDLRYTLAHDEKSAVAKQYGLTYTSGNRGDVAAPAAIVLDREGRIAWFHVARDVRDRPSPDDILAVLRSIP
jgi:peroxiredoxin